MSGCDPDCIGKQYPSECGVSYCRRAKWRYDNDSTYRDFVHRRKTHGPRLLETV